MSPADAASGAGDGRRPDRAKGPTKQKPKPKKKRFHKCFLYGVRGHLMVNCPVKAFTTAVAAQVSLGLHLHDALGLHENRPTPRATARRATAAAPAAARPQASRPQGAANPARQGYQEASLSSRITRPDEQKK
ncbi:hypothetical protein POX_b02181 [Penicillium oxalicum]|uniref:hypothetical protein n=1 Tax=Penicillium oxalicum TaxID=69781 RepID=UPI0020B900D5|nr:hypothetical protein POX_b02181 [Penicillium oxalicum]KAI2792145.1 hypothetical protein POX_b02181 [Penicillium oxalicum]